MMEILFDPNGFITVAKILVFVVFIKAMTIGSEFSFYHWFKYRKRYSKWYFNRESFDPNLKIIVNNYSNYIMVDGIRINFGDSEFLNDTIDHYRERGYLILEEN